MALLKNLGFIKEAAWFPCAKPDPVLIMQAAGQAAFPVLMNAVTFGCRDIVKMRAGISPWHARGMKALINGVIRPDEHNPEWNVLKFTIPIEKALFFFFVADLTVEFIANWQSQVFKLGACGDQPNTFTITGRNPAWVCSAPNTYHNVAYLESERHPPSSLVTPVGFIVPHGWFWSCFFSVNPKAFVNGQSVSSCNTHLRKMNPVAFDLKPQEAKPPWFFNPFTATFFSGGQNTRGPDAEYFYEASADVLAYATGGSLACTVSERPIHDDGIIPVNCFGNPAPGNNPHF